MELVLFAVVAFATAVMSAVAGLGGGVVLLAVLFQMVAPTSAIVIQGAIQLASNSSRAAFLAREVDPTVFGWTVLPVLPASFAGAAVATSVPQDSLRLALGFVVVGLAWRSRPGGTRLAHPATREPRPAPLLALGSLAGFLTTTVGASGPLTSPFLRTVTAGHVAFVATAAATQVIAHLSKLVALGANGVSPVEHLDLVAVGIVGVVAGSAVGTRITRTIDEERLAVVFALVLAALGARLVWQGVSSSLG